MIKRLIIIFVFPMVFIAAWLAHSATFTDSANYSTETYQLNGTSFEKVISNSSTSVTKRIPWNGISIANTNAATTSIVWVIWSNDGAGTGKIEKVTCPGLSTNYIPQMFELGETNQFIKMKMDGVLSNALHIKTFFLLTGKF